MSERIVSALELYPDYEAVIGIEVHVQLSTKSKIFCSCANETNKGPNSNICVVCTGQPGSLPVLNKQVIDYGIRLGLATNSRIAPICSFDRKHYFYPDLPKGYQITQQFEPICTEGSVAITRADGSQKKIRLMRIHLEEDAGKNIHVPHSNRSLVDLNRAGTPLLEVVSYPDIANAEEAKAYLKNLRLMVQYLGICSGNMEEGAFRADTNISVRKRGESTYGVRCELKNINSFKYIGDAIEYEIKRHISALENGESLRQETRLWDTKNHKTIVMRSKEEAADYRYFQDPDLPLVKIDEVWVQSVKNALPELPAQKSERLQRNYKISAYEADILLDDSELASYFEQAYACFEHSGIINWVLRNILGFVKEQKVAIADCKVTPQKLAAIVELLETKKINNHAAQEIFSEIARDGGDPKELVKKKGLEQINSLEDLEKIAKDIIAANPQQAESYKNGNEKLLAFFVGQAMKKTQGKANPQMVQDILKKLL